MTAATPVLRVRDLTVRYDGAPASAPALDHVSLDLTPGETVAVVGESGSGKSTLIKAITRLLAHGRVETGQILFDGVDLLDLGERRFRPLRGREIAVIPQDPAVSLDPVLTVGRQIADVAVIHGLTPRRGAAPVVREALLGVGFAEPDAVSRAYPHELSGGMRQRVLIAMALVARPRVVLADEPTSALDATIQKRVLDVIDDRVASARSALLLVTHDLAIAKDRAHRLVILNRGRVVEAGETHSVLTAPRHAYTRDLLAAAPSFRSERMTPGQGAHAGPDARARRGSASPAIRADGLVKVFGGGRHAVRAVDDVSFAVAAGSTTAVVGESGSGKSTLARILARFERADAGVVRYDLDGWDPVRGLARDFYRHVQMVYQNPYDSLNPRHSVARILRTPLREFAVVPRPDIPDRTAELLASVGLDESLLGRRPHELSGGQCQRVAIARALAVDPRVIVLDEPVSALDVSVQTKILQLLVDLQARLGLTYLFITHDLAVVRQIADDVLVFDRGRIVERGPAEHLFRSPAVAATRELIDAIPGSRQAGDPR